MAPLLSYFVQFDLEKGSQTKYELKKHLKQVRKEGVRVLYHRAATLIICYWLPKFGTSPLQFQLAFFLSFGTSAEESSLGKGKRWRGKKNERNQIKLN